LIGEGNSQPFGRTGHARRAHPRRQRGLKDHGDIVDKLPWFLFATMRTLRRAIRRFSPMLILGFALLGLIGLYVS
jgi:hypothetical protein